MSNAVENARVQALRKKVIEGPKYPPSKEVQGRFPTHYKAHLLLRRLFLESSFDLRTLGRAISSFSDVCGNVDLKKTLTSGNVASAISPLLHGNYVKGDRTLMLEVVAQSIVSACFLVENLRRRGWSLKKGPQEEGKIITGGKP